MFPISDEMAKTIFMWVLSLYGVWSILLIGTFVVLFILDAFRWFQRHNQWDEDTYQARRHDWFGKFMWAIVLTLISFPGFLGFMSIVCLFLTGEIKFDDLHWPWNG